MKAVILAGGMGTRISEESIFRPKPMITIGGKPILWHIMKLYAHYGIKDFVICLGWKGYMIKDYFMNYDLHNSDFRVDLTNRSSTVLTQHGEDWQVELIDTGELTMTGGRLKRVARYVTDTFLMTYGDGVADVDMEALIKQHRSSKNLATLTAVRPSGRFGGLDIEGGQITNFDEKRKTSSDWINGGFFVIEPEALATIEGDETSWEKEPLETLASQSKLGVYKHSGFWSCMDTMRDRNYLENEWASGHPAWKIWN